MTLKSIKNCIKLSWITLLFVVVIQNLVCEGHASNKMALEFILEESEDNSFSGNISFLLDPSTEAYRINSRKFYVTAMRNLEVSGCYPNNNHNLIENRSFEETYSWLLPASSNFLGIPIGTYNNHNLIEDRDISDVYQWLQPEYPKQAHK